MMHTFGLEIYITIAFVLLIVTVVILNCTVFADYEEIEIIEEIDSTLYLF